MTASNIGRCTLRVLPIVVVPIVFLASGPSLKAAAGPLATVIAGGVVALFVVAYANYLAFLVQRRQDEVQQARAGFAAQWGVAAGQAAFVALLVVPAFTDFASGLARNLAGAAPSDHNLVVFAMTFAFCAVVLLQSIGTVILRAIWWRARR